MKNLNLLTLFRIPLFLITLLLVLLAASPAAAVAITVNSVEDNVVAGDGRCTLREAIDNANDDTDTTAGDCAAGDGPDTIFLDSGTYALYFWDGEIGGSLQIGDELNIVGTGAGSTIIDATELNKRAFTIWAAATMSGVTITGGHSEGSGGGIAVTEASLTLIDSEVSGNTAVSSYYDPGQGGGIYLNTGELRLENSTVANNSAVGDGGGIYTDSTYSTLTVLDSTISGNASGGDGGGIANNGGSLTIERSTLDGNTAVSGGGGLYNSGDGYGSISQSTIANNVVGNGVFATNKFGGGVKNVGVESSLDISNSTISGNTAADDGGGLYNNTSFVSLLNVTITNNHALSESGGIDNYGYITYENSIIVGNTAVSANPDCRSLFGWPLVSNGYNLVGSGTGCATIATDLTAAPGDMFTAVPEPLANNGGGTQTHALRPDSPALDAANPDTCPAVDQRGVARPQLDGCDIGAYEADDFPQTGPAFSVNTSDDANDGLCSLAHCSLREAILAANAHDGSDSIQFDIPETYFATIEPLTALPAITDPITISNYLGTTFVELAGTALESLADGLVLTAGGSTIEELVIRDFTGHGLFIDENGGNQVAYSTIHDNGGDGIRVSDGSSNAFTANEIYNNGGLGIDLNGDGVTTNGLTHFPIIIRAVPDGYGTAVTGIYHGQPNSSYTLEFFTNLACDPSGFGEGQQFLGSILATTNNNGNASFSETLYSEGQEIAAASGTDFITATATDANGSTSEFSQCAEIGPGNDSWTRALALPLTPDEVSPEVLTGSYDQFIDKQDQSRWFKFQVQPGSQLVVTLTGLPENYDLTVYKDIAATFNEMLTAEDNADLLELTAEFAPDAFSPDAFSPDAFSPDAFSPDAFSPDAFSPDAFSPDAFSPDAFSPDAFSPDAFSPDAFSPDAFSPDAFSPDAFSPDTFSPDAFSPDAFSPDAFSSAQTRSLIGVSAFNGTAGEGIALNTWESSGDFYIRVRGRNGAFSLESPFHLAVVMTTGTCTGVSTALPASSIVPAASNANTIILADLARLTADPQAQADVQAKLAQLAARPEVNGVVVDVSSDPRIAAANAQADAHPTCPFAKNLVAHAIKDVVDGYRSLNPLQYVVIIGSDDVIPFFRHPDQALLANERNYVPPVRDNTTSQATLKLGYFLGQDRYGAGREISSRSDSLPIPDLAVGRLVETPGEVIGMVDAYLNGTVNGVVPTPTTSLVTGYDFLEDAANAVTAELEAGIGSPADTLITPRDLSPQDPAAWTADDLRAVLLGSRHDITYLAGHFSASSALAADYTTRLLASEIAASAVDLTNALIYSAGCHSGYNIVNDHGIPGVTSEPDWAQAFAQKQATLIAGTGYQYGDTDFIEYSERLYLEFSRQLRLGTGPVAIGQALVAAKQVYLAETPQLRPIHEKALLESSLFGLPFLKIDMPAGRGTPAGDGSIVTGTSGFAANPGLTLGLQYADVSITPSLTTEQVELDIIDSNGSTGTVTATYLRGSNGVFTNPAEPVLPLERRNVSVPGTVLRGVGFRGGSFTDLPNILPLTGAATTEIRGVHPPFLSSVFYPVQFWRVNYFEALANGGATRLSVSPAQYQSDSPGSLTGTLRRFNDVDFRLYYSGYTAQSAVSGNNPALSAAPAIANVSTGVQGSDMQFIARVVGDPAAGIQEVWVTFTALSGPYAGQWQSLDLTQSLTDSTRWQGTLPLNGTLPEDVQFIVQAVNGVGLVSSSTNLGSFLTATAVTPPTDPEPTELTLLNPPTTGAYGSTITAQARLTSNGTPLANQFLTFKLGPQQRSAVTDANGEASVTLALLGLPGSDLLKVGFAGTADYQPASATNPFTITRQPTGLTLDPANLSILNGETADFAAVLTDSMGRPLSEKTIIFIITGSSSAQAQSVITDYAGRAFLSITPPADTYAIDAYFSGIIPLPGQTLNLEDGRFLPSTAAADLTVNPAADLAISKAASTELLQVGEVMTFTLSVSNGGPDTAQAVNVSDDVPANFTINTAAATAGSCAVTGQSVSCDLGDLASGGTAGVEVGVTAVTEGPTTNTATVTSATADPNNDNDSSSTAVTIASSAPIYYFSTLVQSSIGGVDFGSEDILAYDTGSGEWSLAFDGSDVGLAYNDVDAFHILDNGDILLSLRFLAWLPGLGLVDGSDIIKFVPTSLGEDTSLGQDTAGSFEMFLDGSDVGLTKLTENVNAIGFTPDGRLVISTNGPVHASQVNAKAQDLSVLNNGVFGWQSGGTWELYFDGSDTGLQNGREDIWGVWIDSDNDDIYLTTAADFSAGGVSGTGDDVIVCQPSSLGASTTCTLSLFWDGSSYGFEHRFIDGFAIQR
jgi:uncharacterized repeat protein (TIGR01451 family)/CSLREA domain-containing protein